MGDDVGGQALDQRVQAALAIEGLAEAAPLQEGQDARRDAARDEHAAGRQHHQRQVAGDRAQHRAEHRQRHLADGIGPGQRALGDRRGRIVAGPGRASAAAVSGRIEAAAGRLFGQEREHVDQPLARTAPLARHPAVLDGQELHQPVLQRRARREVDVAPLGWDDLVAVLACADQSRNAWPRPVPAPSTAIGPCATGGPPPSAGQLGGRRPR